MVASSRMQSFTLVGLSLSFAVGQQIGTQQPESHPPMWMQECTHDRCDYVRGEVVLDANWRWINKDGQNCYMNDNTWNPSSCPDGTTCASNCGVEGADYRNTYGITTNRFKDGLNLNFVTSGPYSTNFGSRLYYMDTPETYKMFKLLNREFSIDVDVSHLPCGLNGAIYFVEMDRRGDFNGDSNKAGARYGTGYCDAQCPHDIKFIKGQANIQGWNKSNVPPVGHYGACCAEMDIWEANSQATAFTPHPCSQPGLTMCEGIQCGDNAVEQRYDGICDKDGCDFNSYRMGADFFYGPGDDFTVDTSKPVTVVTQFLTVDDTDTGDLAEIKRFYVQDGQVIPNSEATILGGDGGNSITDHFCDVQKETFGDLNDFRDKGALKTMGDALGRGMVLVMSLWDDSDVSMLWLDSAYPPDQPPRKAGVLRGPCSGAENAPSYVRANSPDAHVEFSQIKVGPIGSTFSNSDRRLNNLV